MFYMFKSEKSLHTNSLEEAREALESSFCYREPHETTLDKIQVNGEGFVKVDSHGEFSMTQSAFGMLNSIAGIPNTYAASIDKDLWLTNLNVRTAYNKKPVWVSTSVDAKGETYITAFSKDNKAQARNKDILNLFDDEEAYEVRVIRLWDSGMQVAITVKGLGTIEPVVGDISEIGFKAVNSEIGRRSAKLEGMTFRLICSNGAMLGELFGCAYWPSDKRLSYPASFAAFQKEFSRLSFNVEHLKRLYEASIEKRLTVKEIVTLWRRTERAVQSREAADRILRLGIVERKTFIGDERERQIFEKAHNIHVPSPETSLILYETFNHITEYAREVSSFSIAHQLEQIAGSALVLDVAKAA